MKFIFKASICRSIWEADSQDNRHTGQTLYLCTAQVLQEATSWGAGAGDGHGGMSACSKGHPVDRGFFRFTPGPPSQGLEVLIRWLCEYLRSAPTNDHTLGGFNTTEMCSPTALEARRPNRRGGQVVPSGGSEGRWVPGPILGPSGSRPRLAPWPADTLLQPLPPPSPDIPCVSSSASYRFRKQPHPTRFHLDPY